MEEGLHDVPQYRDFARLDTSMTRIPDQFTILRSWHRLEEHSQGAKILNCVNTQLAHAGLLLKTGMVVEATLIAAPVPPRTAPANVALRGTEPRRAISCTAV